MIRHQMTGAGLHTLSFRGPEAKSRYLPTLRHLLQAVKSTCRTGVVKKCKSFFAALFMPLFLQMTVSGPPPVVIKSGAACRYQDKGLRAL